MTPIINKESNCVFEDVPYHQLKEEYNKLYSTNKELLESIYYAASVQQGLLPQERHFRRNFEDFFVFYRPLHIIGGDLYWVGRKNDTVYFAVGDCTGHGVSGSMLSVLAASFLNYVILGKKFDNLSQVMNELDKKWLETFNFSMDYVFDNDWMEISLGSFNYSTRELKFAGANNDLLVVNGTKAFLLSGNSYPIGGWQIEKHRDYYEQTVRLRENSFVYLWSDGFKDQFGGATEKRFRKNQLISLLQEISHLPAASQKIGLEKIFDNWKGALPQTDDVCLMGLRL